MILSKLKLAISFILFLLAGYIVPLRAQENYSINGTVKDEKGQTLPGATVFLTGTKTITICDGEGMFHLNNISPGSYVLVTKMIGFTAESVPVAVKAASVTVDVVLKPKINALNEVTITFDPNWDDHLAEFKRKFLGTTPNAGECKILNPKVLHFRYSKRTNTLSATAEDFIVIENAALGYKINYLLNSFEYNYNTHILEYQGSPSFAELTPKSDKQLKYWNKNREIAYNGSVTHFMKAIYDDRVVKEGFEVYKVINKPPPGVPYDREKPLRFDLHPVLFDSLLTTTDKHFKTLKYKDCLFVVYANERESYEFSNTGYKLERPTGGKVPNGQFSMVNLVDTSVSIDGNGNFSNPGGLLFEGYMAWEQIADLMPLEYGKEK